MALKNEIRIIALIIGSLVIVTILIFISFYVNIFRMSATDVKTILKNQAKPCNNPAACILLPGDILIRRYITPNTTPFDSVIRPYFTHTAYYEGDGDIIEAAGTQKNRADDIRVVKLNQSDWIDSGIEKLVIMRPKYINDDLKAVTDNLLDIVNDNNYHFGLSQLDNKSTSCAEMIFNQLEARNLVEATDYTELITPDYLFWNLSLKKRYSIFNYKIDESGLFRIAGH